MTNTQVFKLTKFTLARLGAVFTIFENTQSFTYNSLDRRLAEFGIKLKSLVFLLTRTMPIKCVFQHQDSSSKMKTRDFAKFNPQPNGQSHLGPVQRKKSELTSKNTRTKMITKNEKTND